MASDIWMGVLVVAGLVASSGCDKPAPESPQQTIAKPQTIAAAKPEVPESAPVEADIYADVADADWCPNAHDDIVKIVTAMQATMERAGTKSDTEYKPPERPRFLELCETLPMEMRKCLVVGYAARNRDACQVQLEGLNPDQKTAYAELMGK